MAARLGESELLEFLFLPGFTLKETVTEISGRGVGLDVVQNLVKNVRGAIRLSNQPGRGLRVQLQLPLTLSVLRALLVQVAGEPYAIPLTPGASALRPDGRDGGLTPARSGRYRYRDGSPQGDEKGTRCEAAAAPATVSGELVAIMATGQPGKAVTGETREPGDLPSLASMRPHRAGCPVGMAP